MRDIDIREALLSLHRGEPDTRVVEELGLCQGVSRVDVAVVNGSIHGYEIKSERDTLVRLPAQKDVYSQVLDYVTIVTAQTHAKKVAKEIPSWWGIWSVGCEQGDIHFEVTREAFRNPNINAYALAQLLWREEALQVLSDRKMAIGIRSKSREHLWSRLASNLTVEDLGAIVRERLKQRSSNWRPLGRQD
jgi:hypothetical protein